MRSRRSVHSAAAAVRPPNRPQERLAYAIRQEATLPASNRPQQQESNSLEARAPSGLATEAAPPRATEPSSAPHGRGAERRREPAAIAARYYVDAKGAERRYFDDYQARS